MLSPDEYVEMPKYEHLVKAYEAITAERDEWKRRCEKMWRTIQLGAPLDREITIFMSNLDQQRWIAEGRDNG